MSKPDWNRIHEFYRRNTLAIYEAGPSMWGIDMYAWEYEAGVQLTPIERALWGDIRACAAVLYPQYPVGSRFVDFGNPVARVAIECDGAAFHVDAEADAARQAEIEAQGWIVYRFTGRECFFGDTEEETDFGTVKTIHSPTARRVREIAEAHGIRLWCPPGRRKPGGLAPSLVARLNARDAAA